MFDKLEDLLIRFEEIMGELNEPNVTENQERFRKLMKEQTELAPVVEAYREYKAAKQDKNRNESRIRYLQRMIRTARVVKTDHAEGKVGLFDYVTLYLPEDDEEMEVHLVTTLRVDAGGGHISRQSPLGRAIFGRKVGDTVTVQVNADVSYPVTIRGIRPGTDDENLPISQY